MSLESDVALLTIQLHKLEESNKEVVVELEKRNEELEVKLVKTVTAHNLLNDWAIETSKNIDDRFQHLYEEVNRLVGHINQNARNHHYHY